MSVTNLDRASMITVVSGIPRSGTSMMMQALRAGGLELLSDGHRHSDQDNPRGYFEFDSVKHLAKESTFVAQAVGRVVKIVAPLLSDLPSSYAYRVIFMERAWVEVMASQQAMMERSGQGEAFGKADQAMVNAFQNQVEGVKQWLDHSENVSVCYVSHRFMIESPIQACFHVANFLEETGTPGEEPNSDERVRHVSESMAEVVDQSLYRQRESVLGEGAS